MRNASGQFFADDKFAFMEEGEEVAALEHLHHDVNRVLVLEHVEELYNVGVLAQFEDLYLAFEQFKILERQLLLLNDLDCALIASLFVNSGFHQSILALAQVVT